MPATTRMLVVADDPKVTSLAHRTLGWAGFAVETACGGQSALRAARRQHPDLVVLDVIQPGLDRLGVCSQLRVRSGGPIVMLMARDAADRIAGLANGADD